MIGAPAAASSSFDNAYDAWRRGDYLVALNGFTQLLSGPAADQYLDRIALTTGELYRTTELTADGRAGRFSPDGRYIAYETGLETSTRTRIVRSDRGHALVAELPGVSAAFTRDGSKVAYLRIDPTPDIAAATRAVEGATLTQSNRNALVQALTWTIARDSKVVVRDLATGAETPLGVPPMLKTALAWDVDSRTVLFLGTREGYEDVRTDIYAIAEGDPGPTLVVDASGLKNPPLNDPNGAALVYVVPNVSPLRRPSNGAGGAGRAGGAGGTRLRAEGAAPGQARPPSTFAVADRASKRVSVIAGTAPALSADGRMLAYIARDGAEYVLMAGPTTGLQTALKRTTARMDAPALSADGRWIAWQMMPRDDWEIYVADVAGSALANERRITREIQHDVLPRFLTNDRLMAMVGEPRHRRAYLYDLPVPGSADNAAPAAATRLFHNNTIRTIAPEYQWAPSPDGTRIVVGAERDGDTVSPARGVYVVDLNEKVTKADLIARLRLQLRHETALRATASHLFTAIAGEVRPIVSRVSVDRIFGYEKALFDFDSKHIARPGNQLASAFLFNTYASFGYEPEYQWFDPSATREVAGGRTANVVATLRGTTNPELVYVVSSHYDSVEGGAGADDDSSGTAALLEVARVLAGHPLPATVVFASMTGEEAGLLGSREFVRVALERKTRIAAAFNNDMIGWTNDERLDNTIRYSNAGIRDIQHAAALTFTKLITYDALYWKGTDAASFYDGFGDAIGGFGSYPVLGSPYYHQPNDALENENHQLIAETAKATAASIILLASSPSRLTNLAIDSYSASGGGALSLSWTPSPEKGVASYIVAYGPPTAPLQHRITVVQPRATLAQVPPGTIVSVKAVNARGLEGWDWARITVADSRRHRPTQ